MVREDMGCVDVLLRHGMGHKAATLACAELDCSANPRSLEDDDSVLQQARRYLADDMDIDGMSGFARYPRTGGRVTGEVDVGPNKHGLRTHTHTHTYTHAVFMKSQTTWMPHSYWSACVLLLLLQG